MTDLETQGSLSPVKNCLSSCDSDDSPVKVTKSKSSRRRGLAARLKKVDTEETDEVSDHAAVYSTKVSKFFGSGSMSLTSIIKQDSVKRHHTEKVNDEDDGIHNRLKNVQKETIISEVILDDDEDDELPCTPKMAKTTVDLVKSPTPPPLKPPSPPAIQTIMTKRTRMSKKLKKALSNICDAREHLISDRLRAPEDDDVVYIGDDTDDTITTRIKHGNDTYRFPVKQDDLFNHIFEKMAKKLDVQSSKIIMLLNDRTIYSHDSPKSLGLTTADIIYCHVSQGDRSILEDSIDDDTDTISLYVQSKLLKHKQEFRISKHHSFDEIIRKYALQTDSDPAKLRLQFDGEDITCDETPSELELEDGYCLDIIHVS